MARPHNNMEFYYVICTLWITYVASLRKKITLAVGGVIFPKEVSDDHLLRFLPLLHL